MRTAVKAKKVLCILATIVFACMIIPFAHAMDSAEKSEMTTWLNTPGPLKNTLQSISIGLFRIDTEFYDGLTDKQIEQIQAEKDVFMRKVVEITGDKYGHYFTAEQVKEQSKIVKYKGIGVILEVPRSIQKEREKFFKEQIIKVVPGLNLTEEDFEGKNVLSHKLIKDIAGRLGEKSPEFKKFWKEFTEGFLGKDGMEIVSVIANGPSDKAGLKKYERTGAREGWRITQIDGVGSDGLFIWEFSEYIKKGTKNTVKLSLSPPPTESSEKPIEVIIEKGYVYQTWLTNEIRQTEVGQIGIISFNNFDFSAQEGKLNIKMFEDALTANKDSVAIVINLKNNGGGSLLEADMVLDRFLPNGRTEIIISNRKNKRELVSSSDVIKRLWGDKPIVFVVNERSASASELVSGSMREQLPDLVKLIGSPTFGKGSIQTWARDYPDGTQMNITTGRFKMPISEKTFEGEPLQPDVLVEDDVNTPKDEQIEKAIEVLKQLVIFHKGRKEALEALKFK